MREAKDLTDGPIGKQIVALALPILGNSFILMLYSFVDMAWLGRLSSQTVAASGAASIFTWLVTCFTLITKVGAEVTVANGIGRKDERAAADFAAHNITLALYLGLTTSLVFALFTESFIGFYGLEAPVDRYATDYLRICALGFPFIFLSNAFIGIYNASGLSKIPFVVNVIGLGLNMLLDPILIFVLGLGIRGAALATIISQAILMSLLLIQMKYRDRLLGGFRMIRKLSGRTTQTILRLGVPAALMNAFLAVINLILGRFASAAGGATGVMTLTIGGQLEGITWNAGQGFSTSLSSFVSQNYGAAKYGRIREGLRFTLWLCLFFGIIGTLINYFGGSFLFSLIIPNDPHGIASGAEYLRIDAWAQIFMMVEVCFQGFFYGMRRPLPPSAISIGCNFLRIPLALALLHFVGGIACLWWTICITCILKGTLAGGYYLLKGRARIYPPTEEPTARIPEGA